MRLFLICIIAMLSTTTVEADVPDGTYRMRGTKLLVVPDTSSIPTCGGAKRFIGEVYNVKLRGKSARTNSVEWLVLVNESNHVELVKPGTGQGVAVTYYIDFDLLGHGIVQGQLTLIGRLTSPKGANGPVCVDTVILEGEQL